MKTTGMVQRAAKLSGDLSIRTLDLHADIAALADRVTEQADTVERIGGVADRLEDGRRNVSSAVREAQDQATTARSVIDNSSRRLDTATNNVVDLIEQVSQIHDGLGSFNAALATVASVTDAITHIAAQIKLLSLNATIEAARAGESGRGFAVVAQEVRKLAQEAAAATRQIDTSVIALTGEASAMLQRISTGVDKARSAHDGTREIETLVASLNTLMLGLSDNTDSVAGNLEAIVGSVSGIRDGLNALTDTSSHNAADLVRLSDRLTQISDDHDFLLQHFSESGVVTPDSPYIEFALKAAQTTEATLLSDIAERRLTLATLFSDIYTPVPGTNPQQYDHSAEVRLVSAARPIQEVARALPGFFGMTWTDRNTYTAVQMAERSLPQRLDVAWNQQFSRHKQMLTEVGRQVLSYQDMRKACATTQPFIIKAYRRPLENGTVLLLKQVIASIHIDGRHWGILQLAYEDQG